MIKHEAKAQSIWGQYISTMHAEFINGTRKFEDVLWNNGELKQSQTDTIPWKRWNKKSDAHQLEELQKAELYGYYWKHSDADPRQKPFDCGLHMPAPSYIVIYWELHKQFTVIRIGDFLVERAYSTEKSISYLKAKEIAFKIINI